MAQRHRHGRRAQRSSRCDRPRFLRQGRPRRGKKNAQGAAWPNALLSFERVIDTGASPGPRLSAVASTSSLASARTKLPTSVARQVVTRPWTPEASGLRRFVVTAASSAVAPFRAAAADRSAASAAASGQPLPASRAVAA